MIIRTYSELIKMESFEERFAYLKLDGQVGIDTFGHNRYLNQILYNSPEWKRCRREIIIRDNGCDLGCRGHEIMSYYKDKKTHRETHGKILVHHINPITVEDILNRNPMVFDPENLITTIHNTHNAIHYGDESLLIQAPVTRTKNDTCPWRRV